MLRYKPHKLNSFKFESFNAITLRLKMLQFKGSKLKIVRLKICL